MISPGALAATHARQAPKPTNKFRQGVRANESAKESAPEFDRRRALRLHSNRTRSPPLSALHPPGPNRTPPTGQRRPPATPNHPPHPPRLPRPDPNTPPPPPLRSHHPLSP